MPSCGKAQHCQGIALPFIKNSLNRAWSSWHTLSPSSSNSNFTSRNTQNSYVLLHPQSFVTPQHLARLFPLPNTPYLLPPHPECQLRYHLLQV